MRPPRAHALLISSLALASPAALRASPATFVTALPVATGQVLVRFNFETILGSQQFLGIQSPVNIAYGLTSRWAIFVNPDLGYGSIQSGDRKLSSAGSGDTLLFARYTLYKKDKPVSTFRIAPLAGADLPSGNNTLHANGQLLPGILQTGSGTVDPYVGVTTGYNCSEWGWAADATYRYNPVAGVGIGPGSEFRADGQIERRLIPVRLPEEGLPSVLVATLETNYSQDSNAHLNGALVPFSASRILKEDLFFEWSTLHWQIGIGAQIPIVQRFDAPGRIKERVGAFLFYEYYLAAPDWRHRRHTT